MAAELSRAAMETFDALGMENPAERLRDALGKRASLPSRTGDPT